MLREGHGASFIVSDGPPPLSNLVQQQNLFLQRLLVESVCDPVSLLGLLETLDLATDELIHDIVAQLRARTDDGFLDANRAFKQSPVLIDLEENGKSQALDISI